MLHMLDQFPIEPHLLPFVLVHMLLELTLCSFGPHELIHASGVGLLPKIPGVLTSVKHLHHGEHSAHSGTRTFCPLISVSDQRVAVVPYPNCCRWIHSRKSTSGTVDKLIPVLLTNLTQHLKSNHLGTFPRSSSIGLIFPLLPEWRLCTSRDS